MSVWPTFLRVLLSVTLVLNGASAAAAAVRMQMSHSMADAKASPAKALPAILAVDMPCHDQASGVASEAPAAVVDPDPAKSEHSTPDCCKSLSCNCVCVQTAQAPPANVFVNSLLAGHSRDIRPTLPGHASPALPHLNRPPIA
jgi:hypothetical protein